VRTILVIALEVGTYQAEEMALAEDHDMVEKLAPITTDPAFADVTLDEVVDFVCWAYDLTKIRPIGPERHG
jgi:hypothetical protein